MRPSNGVVHTRRHIVELMLDLCRYDAAQPLGQLRLLEPSCGHGAFLLPAVERLLEAWKRARQRPALEPSILAFEVDAAAAAVARGRVAAALRRGGLLARPAARLARHWIHCEDFLAAADLPDFEFVIGNPPYVRLEAIDRDLQRGYEQQRDQMSGRADLYVAFIARGLDRLAVDGVLAFLCADRWTRNRYGEPLRRRIARDFCVEHYVDLTRAAPFEHAVAAYPSIFTLRRGEQAAVQVTRLATGSPEECGTLRAELSAGSAGDRTVQHADWFQRGSPWVLSSPDQKRALRDLERRLQPIEAEGRARVGIGIATGRDAAFIVPDDAAIEPDRLLPLVKRADLSAGRVLHGGHCVLDTFAPGGGPLDLGQYPGLARHLRRHEETIRARPIARRNPAHWYRTIDRPSPELVRMPKLLLPDIARTNQVTLDPGRYHPHHNLYHVTSREWDLEVLGALLSSRVALFFVWSYSPRLRGGYLRFQAQHLRRIRLPAPGDLARSLQGELRRAFQSRDLAAMDALAEMAFGVQLPDFDHVETRR